MTSASAAWFGTLRRYLLSVVFGLLAGGGACAAQGVPTRDPIVLLNGFAQVLPVSIAEVLVCWSVVGVAAGSSLARRSGRVLRGVITALVAGVLFAVYQRTAGLSTRPRWSSC